MKALDGAASKAPSSRTEDGEGNKGISRIKQTCARGDCGHNSVGDCSSLEGGTLGASVSRLTYKFRSQAGTSGGLITHGARGQGPVESSCD
jgi:hypothetical protein